MAELADLPNLGKVVAAQLKRAGVETPSQLRRLGSVGAALKFTESGVDRRRDAEAERTARPADSSPRAEARVLFLRTIPLLFILALVAGATGAAARDDEASTGEVAPVTITVIYDNRAGPSEAEGLDPAWGFACLIEGLSETILFDTGGDSPTLLSNMATLGIAPESIDVVVLSHAHDDHAGGLAGLLDVHGAVKVYLLESFPGEIADAARARGAEVVRVTDAVAICPGAVLSGDMTGRNEIHEQCLLLTSDTGAAVVTGCAHPGIVDMVERAKELIRQDVVAILGGLHLLRTSDEAVDGVISDLKELGVRRVVPCHCTGDRAIERFAVSYGDGFTRCATGTVVDLGALLAEPDAGE